MIIVIASSELLSQKYEITKTITAGQMRYFGDGVNALARPYFRQLGKFCLVYCIL